MFGFVERLEEGKKVRGENHFSSFGITDKRSGKKDSAGTHIKILSALDWTETRRSIPVFTKKTNLTLLILY
jgi:hypothetical protein